MSHQNPACLWSPYVKVYDPLKAGSIDGTDTVPHDNGVIRALNSKYIPPDRRTVTSDPQCTLFVSRLNLKTTDRDVEKEFSQYGKVKNCCLVRNIVTGSSRGYAFVEFKWREDAERAWRKAHNTFLHDRQLLVEWEFARTMPGWVPRRLGGGLGGKKESGQLRFGGRDRPFRKPLLLPQDTQPELLSSTSQKEFCNNDKIKSENSYSPHDRDSQLVKQGHVPYHKRRSDDQDYFERDAYKMPRNYETEHKPYWKRKSGHHEDSVPRDHHKHSDRRGSREFSDRKDYHSKADNRQYSSSSRPYSKSGSSGSYYHGDMSSKYASDEKSYYHSDKSSQYESSKYASDEKSYYHNDKSSQYESSKYASDEKSYRHYSRSCDLQYFEYEDHHSLKVKKKYFNEAINDQDGFHKKHRNNTDNEEDADYCESKSSPKHFPKKQKRKHKLSSSESSSESGNSKRHKKRKKSKKKKKSKKRKKHSGDESSE